jgi:hypothetical protein
MEKELLGLSPVNLNAVWKRLSKGTNSPYEKIYTSLLVLYGPATIGTAGRGASPIPIRDQ